MNRWNTQGGSSRGRGEASPFCEPYERIVPGTEGADCRAFSPRSTARPRNQALRSAVAFVGESQRTVSNRRAGAKIASAPSERAMVRHQWAPFELPGWTGQVRHGALESASARLSTTGRVLVSERVRNVAPSERGRLKRGRATSRDDSVPGPGQTVPWPDAASRSSQCRCIPARRAREPQLPRVTPP